MTLKTKKYHPQAGLSESASSTALGKATGHDRSSLPLRLISLNIRYATNSPVNGEKPWRERCPMLTNQLRFITTGQENPFICLQECLYTQLKDIHNELGDSWSYIGRGREDGEQGGEFSPVFYRADAWTCVRHEVRWLSETPHRPSRGWDAANTRVVSMGLFAHKATGARVIVFATHFDHIGRVARKNSAKLLIEWAAEWAAAEGDDAPDVLIGGDFNSQTDDDAYRMMTARSSGMKDVFDLVPQREHYGNYLTYTSFGEAYENPSRIDFLFVREPRKAEIKTFGVLSNCFDDHVRISDHRAVVADMELKL